MEHVNLSYWDIQHLDKAVDVLIVGAGITGLSCALRIHQIRPDLTLRLVDKHHVTRVASTRNAGFACFGSLTEILEDIQLFGQDTALDLVSRRYAGIQLIQNTFNSSQISYHQTGGYELIPTKNVSKTELQSQMNELNNMLKPIIGRHVFSLVDGSKTRFPFSQKVHLVHNPFEGQLDPSAYVNELGSMLPKRSIEMLAGAQVTGIENLGNVTHVHTSWGRMRANQVVLATNGLTESLGYKHEQILPARNIVLVSDKMKLGFKGVFHAEQGYIYFRNVGDRLLIGGGRHWDKEAEFTGEFGDNAHIVNKLKAYAHEIILPNKKKIEFSHQWAGIMGITSNKKPLIEKLSERLFLAAGFGGMGVALGMHSGFQMAVMVCKEF